MCLVTDQFEPIIVSTPFTAYKVVEEYVDLQGIARDDKWNSLRYGYTWHQGKSDQTELGYTTRDNIATRYKGGVWPKWADSDDQAYWGEVLDEIWPHVEDVVKTGKVMAVGQGFHFYTELAKAQEVAKESVWGSSKRSILECTIPASANIHYGAPGYMVSDRYSDARLLKTA